MSLLPSPMPFLEALGLHAVREIMPTTMTTAELQALDKAIRERSFFSAQNTITEALERMKAVVGSILEPMQETRPARATPENPLGLTTVGFDPASARAELKQLYDAMGYEPEPGKEGTIEDFASAARLKLVVDTNVQIAQGYGQVRQGQDEGALDAFPAWELVRVEEREVPRGFKRIKGGELEEVEGDSWPERFQLAGAQSGTDEGWVLTEDGRMVALKNHPIWEKLGSSDLFKDALDLDYPPFAFNSGMGFDDVPYEEAVAVGVLEPGQEVKPRGVSFALPESLKQKAMANRKWWEELLVNAGEVGNPYHDAHGRFTSGSSAISLQKTDQRAFSGESVELKEHPSKQEVGALGEKIIIAHLKAQGLSDARPLNEAKANYAVDLVQDHGAIEVKTGLASNGKSAQQWRATIGQPGKAETEWLKKASPEDKAAWNEKKAKDIMDRKNAAVADLSKKLGRPVKSWTMTSIINPDTRTADIYKFEGFHARIAWNSPEAKKAYVGSYKY